MKAVIGVTPCMDTATGRFFISRAYVNAIYKNGGIPFVLSPVHKRELPLILDRLNGILLTGGGDINPLLLGEEPCKNMGEISTLRDVFEIHLTRLAFRENVPILGICRGMQVMAAAAGGKIIQDIDSPLCHMQKSPRYIKTHTVYIKKGTLLSSICREKSVSVNSFHHQAVLECGKNFRPCGFSADGMIEAMENKRHAFALGVQWHPENLYNKNKCQQNIFTTFITKAENTRRI